MQFRDALECHHFRFDGAEIKNGKLNEICIMCDKCKNYITLGVD